MTNQSSFNKVHLLVEIFIAFLLFIVIGLLSYDIFKPGLVTQETINELKKSVNLIEKYTKELQVTASLSRQQINEDNALSEKEKIHRENSYNDLLSRYGFIVNENNDEQNPSFTDSLPRDHINKLR